MICRPRKTPILFALALACLPFSSPQRAAAAPSDAPATGPTRSDAADRATVRALGDSISRQNVLLPHVLKQVGFPPPDLPETWRNWERLSSERLLALAYNSAEAAKPGSGVPMLHTVVRLIAANHVDAIRYEPNLADIFHETADQKIEVVPVSFAFSAPKVGASMKLPPDLRAIVEVVARYTDTIPDVYLLDICCSLTEGEVEDVHARTATTADALDAAVTLHPPPPSLHEKVGRLTTAAHQLNPALGHEGAIVVFGQQKHAFSLHDTTLGEESSAVEMQADTAKIIAALSPTHASPLDPPSGFPPGPPSHDSEPPKPDRPFQGGPTPTGTSGGGSAVNTQSASASGANSGSAHPIRSEHPAGLGSSANVVAREYETFERSFYATPEAARFGRMILRSGGFGGVIFGNSVTAKSVSAPKKAYWISGAWKGDESWGRLGFILANGRVVISGPLSADSALAAQRLTLAKDAPKNGVGLVGFVGRFGVSQYDSEVGMSYAVHPAVADTKLGRALIELDTLPQVSDGFLAGLAHAGVPEPKIEFLKRFFRSKIGQYKWTDTPLEITEEPGAILIARRSASDRPDASVELRTGALLDMRTFDGLSPRLQVANGPFDIYPLVPYFNAASEAFARANEFSRAYGLLRWARTAGATWIGSTPPATVLTPVSAVLVDRLGGEDLKFTFAESELTVSANWIRSFETEAADLVGPSILLAESQIIAKNLRDYVERRSALEYAGDPESFAEASYTAASPLTLAHPDFFDHIEGERAGRSADIGWIATHLDVLARGTPGLPERIVLTKQLSSISDAVNSSLSQQNLCAKMLGEMEMEDCRNDLELLPLMPQCCKELDEERPGFRAWFALASRTTRRILGD